MQRTLRTAHFGALFAAVLSLASATAAAGDLNCTIAGASEVTGDGRLDALEGKKNYYETVAGAEFIVQRDKGLMMGRFVSNAGQKITVIDQGSAQNSYKVLSVSPRAGGRVQSQYFEVRLQDKGEKKPFVLVAAEVLHGFCTQ
jgi:hypothetical protein